MEEPTFWDDNSQAQKVIAACNRLRSWTVPYGEVRRRYADVSELLRAAAAEGESDFMQELLGELTHLENTVGDLEVRRMLSGELDDSNCYLMINAGAGGTESCDWALMLSRMYQRWGARRGWEVEIVDFLEGEVAGIKNVVLKLSGSFAYGYAKAEKGIHRLVRISPFDSNARRHTSFASVEVSPEISDSVPVDIRPDDVRVDTYRSSGAGGQHVNKTDSAVRVTHLSTGIVVACQTQRSQVQNREACFQMLRSKLYEKVLEEREAHLKSLSGEKKDNAWGSQIRNYVFQPYTLVKDTRTKVEKGDIQAVMDGDIDLFINAYLMQFG